MGDGNILRRKQAKFRPLHSAGKIGGFGENEVTFTIIQENRHELRVKKRSDDKIGELVSVHVSWSDLQAPGRPDKADCGFGSGTEIKVDRILRAGKAIARDTDKRQIRLQVAVKIRDGKLRGAKRDGCADEARDGSIRISDLQVPCPEGCNQAQNRESR